MEDNLFQGNVGFGGADINTPGAAAPSTGITIQNNTSIDDDTFVVINNTTGTRILNNTITHTNPAAASGSGIIMFSANTGIVISGNTIDGGTGGIADFGGPQPPGGPYDREQHDQQSRGRGSAQPARSDGEWERHLELDPVRHLNATGLRRRNDHRQHDDVDDRGRLSGRRRRAQNLRREQHLDHEHRHHE